MTRPDGHARNSDNQDYTALTVSVDRGVAWVTIDHPPLNLLDATLMTDLDRVVRRLGPDDTVSVVILQSADPDFFVAHGDMGFLDDPDTFAALPLGDADSALNPMMRLHEAVRLMPQLTIGKLAGLARGGGAELLTALDLRFAAIGPAGLGQFEALTGIIPGAGGTAYLPPMLGRARALEVILGGQLIDAVTAERWGWVNRALPTHELDSFVDSLALRIAALPREVISAAITAVDAAAGPLDEALRAENTLLGELFVRPAAGRLTRAALAAGAQTREGELRLEGLLDLL